MLVQQPERASSWQEELRRQEVSPSSLVWSTRKKDDPGLRRKAQQTVVPAGGVQRGSEGQLGLRSCPNVTWHLDNLLPRPEPRQGPRGETVKRTLPAGGGLHEVVSLCQPYC